MKFAGLVLLVAVVTVHAAPKGDADDNWKKCLAENDIKEEEFEELLKKDDSKLYCLMACVYEKEEVLKNGELNEDELVLYVLDEVPKLKEATVRKALDSCKQKVNDASDVCELTNKLTDCLQELIDEEGTHKDGKM